MPDLQQSLEPPEPLEELCTRTIGSIRTTRTTNRTIETTRTIKSKGTTATPIWNHEKHWNNQNH